MIEPGSRRFLSGARTRILLAYIVLLGLSGLASVVAIGEILGARTSERVDEALEQEVQEFRTLARGRDPRTAVPFGTDVRRIFDVYVSRNVPGEGETIATYVGDRVYRTVSSTKGGRAQLALIQAELVGLPTSRSGELPGPQGPVRYLSVPVELEGDLLGTFVVTADLGNELEEVDEARAVVALVLAGVLLVASALAWLVAGRVLAPLRLLSSTAQSITESDLSRRIPVRGDDELARLSGTFNAMLDRLESAFDSQRAFVNDASHELRTPITIVRGHLELLGDDPEERRETIALVTDELDRMSRFVDDLLLLAKLQRGGFLRPEPVDVGDLTAALLAKARGLGDREWVAAGRADGVVVHADRQRLTQALMGLAQNAVQHTDAGSRIEIGSAGAAGEVALWVRDHGPGVPAADQERIFERFARASNARRRSEGAGLGLSIVRAIAEAHEGRVELDSRPGEGARFTVIIPVS